jgi:hypothetical protein
MQSYEELTQGGWVMLCLGAGVAVVAAALVQWTTLGIRLSGWSRRYGLSVTAENRPRVEHYLRRTRLLQICGAAIGWVAAPLYIALVGRPFPLGDSWVALAIGGYLIGAVLAEIIVGRAPRGVSRVRSAALVPRMLRDYLPAGSLWAIRVLPAVTLALSVVAALGGRAMQSPDASTVVAVGALAALSIAFSVTIEWLLRAIVARRQPATSRAMIEADDALRASSLHALSAGAVALLMLGVAWALVIIGTIAAPESGGGLLTTLAAVIDVLAMIAWLVLGHPRSWRVLRGARLDGAG